MTDILSTPRVIPRPGGHEFAWPDQQLYLRLERLRESHDNVSAELWAEQGEAREHIMGGIRFSLTTATGRGTMAKALLARRNGVDWGGMMEQVCVYSLRRFREQEPWEVVGQLPATAKLEFTLAPVLPKGVISLLFGYGGVAKTTIAYLWGLLIQTGVEALGLSPSQGPVLLLDWETNKELADRTLKQLAAGTGLPGQPTFLYRRCRRPLLEFVEDIKAQVDAEGVALVIADSGVKACGGEKEAKENALPMLNALGWLERTCLLISHRPKAKEGEERGAYGSVFFENDCRQAFRMEGTDIEGKSRQERALYHAKHNLMRALPPIGYAITWDDLLGTSVELADVGKMALTGVIERGSLRTKIMALLKTGPLSFADLSTRLGASKTQLTARLTELREGQIILLSEDKRWGLIKHD